MSFIHKSTFYYIFYYILQVLDTISPWVYQNVFKILANCNAKAITTTESNTFVSGICKRSLDNIVL